ncbi:gluconate kinase [Pseudonocardia sp. MH-G8]|nr:gluconate kinase [Pseudonocardia sp. MH-G8]
MHETHIGVVVLLGDRAWKFKKPVRTDFLDFSTAEQRERACHREVELNRRLAPDAYLGVGEMRVPDGSVWEHVVVMARMPDEHRLATIVGDQSSGADEVRQVARAVAAFHARAERSEQIAAAGERDAVRERWEGVLGGLRSAADGVLDRDTVTAIEDGATRFLAGREALFTDRIDASRVVDGHGDLLAQDIFCLPTGPQILDCLEFDDRLRWVDGLDDAAFLAMDLEYHDRPDLADEFLDRYAEFAADPAPAALRHHYTAYRAAVRARVACMRAEQTADEGRDRPVEGSAADPAGEEARRYAQIARGHLNLAAVRLVLVGGLPGTGKSTVAGRLADEFAMTVLSSDRIRKELAGLDPEAPAAERYRSGLYSPEMTDRVYTELLGRAEALLGRGEAVVLDASWTSSDQRERASALAEHSHSDLVAIRCHTPAELSAQRLRNRDGSASDADERVAEAMAADQDPWPGAHDLPTDRSEEDTIARAVALIDADRDSGRRRE